MELTIVVNSFELAMLQIEVAAKDLDDADVSDVIIEVASRGDVQKIPKEYTYAARTLAISLLTIPKLQKIWIAPTKFWVYRQVDCELSIEEWRAFVEAVKQKLPRASRQKVRITDVTCL